MKTSYSNPAYLKAMELGAQAMSLNPPPIPFQYGKSKDEQRNRLGKESETTKSIEIKIDPTNEESETVTKKMRVFADGEPEEFLVWAMEFDEIIRDAPFNNGIAKQRAAVTFLKGRARTVFLDYWNKRVRSREEDEDDNRVFELAFDDLTATFLKYGEKSYRRQVNYMRYGLFMGKLSVREFGERLRQLNAYLEYFPRNRDFERRRPLDDEELVEILVRAAPVQWIQAIMRSNVDPSEMSWEEAFECFERVELSFALEKRAEGAEKPRNREKRKPERGEGAQGKSKYCSICKTNSHNTSECWSKRKRQKTDNDSHKSSKQFIRKEMAAMMQALIKATSKESDKKKKRKKSDDSENPMINYLEKLRLSEDEESQKSAKSTNSDERSEHEDSSHYSSVASKADDYSESSEDAYMSFPRRLLPPSKKPKTGHLIPEVIVEIENKKGKIVPIRALIDTGTTGTLLLKEYLSPRTPKAYKKPERTKWTTIGGTFETKRKAVVNFRLPEFDTQKKVTWKVNIDDTTDPSKAAYDMIIGTDLLRELKVDIKFSDGRVCWEGTEIPFKQRGVLQSREATEDLYYQAIAPPVITEAEERQVRILDADYSAVDIDAHVETLKHLDEGQRAKLKELLHENQTLFQGGLGTLKIKPVRLELKPGAQPYHARAYPVPKAHEEVTKREIDRLTKIGVLEPNSNSEWAAPTFIIPKKTGDVRVVTDFRKLNEAIRRKPFPLPKISDLLQKLEGFKWATAIDLSMGYYHIPLDEYSQKLCTTILPWGKYRYLRLPMGVKNSPDIFQMIMSDLLGDMEDVRVYLDDILITSKGTFEDHLRTMREVMRRLREAGFRANVRKCFFGESALEYLGYYISRKGIQPQPQKVEAIQRIQPPKTKRQLRRFLGMVNYYRDMWRRRSHTLAPLTQMSSDKAKFKWGPEQQKAFEEIKRIMSRETILAFPDFSKEFHVYTDASDYQLGAVIMQDNKPLAFYSRKLTGAQSRYTTGEQELLSIVETLREFKNILWGQQVIVHTDHKNLLYDKMASNRVIRWRLLLEEFGVELIHVKGETNVVADALSRLHMDEPIDESAQGEPDPIQLGQAFGATKRELKEAEFPLSPKAIRKAQQKDARLLAKAKDQPDKYKTKKVEGHELIMLNGKIVVPTVLQPRILAWYHEYLCHPGTTRTEQTIKQIFTWPNLQAHVEQYCKTCRQCQMAKKQVKKYGEIPASQPHVTPWKKVHVDFIGPYTVKTPTKTWELRAMTMIDPATRWFEIESIYAPTAEQAMEAFNNQWLCRYPRPEAITYDNGGEFKAVFAKMCDNYGIQKYPTTAYNPQANGIVERVHLTLQNMLRTFELEERELDEVQPWKPFLSAAAWAIRSTYHTSAIRRNTRSTSIRQRYALAYQVQG